MNGLSWKEYFMRLAEVSASKSKDQHTQVGAVIVGTDNAVRVTGYNGFPRGVKELPERVDRPHKYNYTEHAERNALNIAARNGVATLGCHLYVTMFPCKECTRGIINAGIQHIVIRQESVSPRWEEDKKISIEMMTEAGVTWEFLSTGVENNAEVSKMAEHCD